MKVSKSVIWLSSLIAGLALIAAGVGLLYPVWRKHLSHSRRCVG